MILRYDIKVLIINNGISNKIAAYTKRFNLCVF